MDEDFSNYNQASALKDLGFDKRCLGYWSDWGTQEPFLLTCELGTEKESCSIRRKNFLCKGPTYSQAFRWFRKKYKLHSKVDIQDVELDWYSYEILEVKEGQYNNELHLDMNFKSYEEAESACLDKLIEIVKNGKGINN